MVKIFNPELRIEFDNTWRHFYVVYQYVLDGKIHHGDVIISSINLFGWGDFCDGMTGSHSQGRYLRLFITFIYEFKNSDDAASFAKGYYSARFDDIPLPK